MTAQEEFATIAVELEPQGATIGTLFGKPALKANGRAFACLLGETLAFKLRAGGADHTAAR